MSVPRFSIMRVGPEGAERPVARGSDGTYRDLRSLTEDITGSFLENGGLRSVAEAWIDLPSVDVAGERVGAPIRRPQAVICIGQNYAAHAAESGDSPPELPIVFLKHPNTVVGPYDDIVYPPGATALDWEVELGVIMGARASRLTSAEEALAHVAGYVISHDVSERVWQTQESGGQWSKGKCGPTFNPVGPELVLRENVNPHGLRIWSRVNGEPRQDSNTSDMIFPVGELIRHLSWYMTLEPGDLINTGTPEGVAFSGRYSFLTVGDTVELGIECLSTQKQEVVSGT